MNVLTLSAGEVLSHAARGFESVMNGLHPENMIDWDQLGIAKPDMLNGEFMRGLSHDDRRSVLDSIHDIFMKPVFEGHRPEAREAMHEAITPEAREAKWRYLLALTNDTYDIGLDYVDLEILTPLYRQLAMVERGATNVHMPTTHKLRHNPSIHSLHVVGLAYDRLGEAMEQSAVSDDDREALQGVRRQLMRSALVHDMGELHGELSVANDRKHMTAAQIHAFEESRGLSETEIFIQGVSERAGELERLQWPPALLADKKQALLHDYEVAEDSDKFLGLVHKILERVQSQQDYLRFEGKDFAPPLKTVPYGQDDHKDFMMGYAVEPFHGMVHGERMKASLADLAADYPNAPVAELLVQTLGRELDQLQSKLGDALQPQTKNFADRVLENNSKERSASR